MSSSIMNSLSVRSFKALVKREYWEHKGAMLYAPLIIAAFFAGIMILGLLTGGSITVDHGSNTTITFAEHLPKMVEEFENLSNEERVQAVQIGLYSPVVLFGLVMLIISMFYALASLYDERKDKSILFWKSLPVSDTATVLSKFVTVCLLIPVLYFGVVAVFQLFLMLLSTVLAWFGGSLGTAIWGASNWFVVLFNTLASFIVASLWLAPVWAWLMFASSWAKKTAFLWGVLPIFLISIAEGWVLHSAYFIEMVGKRIAGGFVVMNSNLNNLVGNDMFEELSTHWTDVLVMTEFWGGLIVSAVFLAGAVYIRRYRDES